MDITLRVWRQADAESEGQFETYQAEDISSEASFFEMLDIVNERLNDKGVEPIAFDSDCREGICGTCGVMIDGHPHGPQSGTASCQLHMRKFQDGDTIVVEPWRAKAFPVVRDLVVDRSPFDTIIQAGGYISVDIGNAQDANDTLIPRAAAESSMDAASCIGCAACVAACPNSAANLFTAAKISHLGLLPQGSPERYLRTVAMVETMEEYFGSCRNYGECETACPKSISIDVIAWMNRDYVAAQWKNFRKQGQQV
jgi:succinate dehydrogenase / fumarate reductase iron-sulfur subunit